MIGLGPHAMTTLDWAFVVLLQIALIAAAAFSVRVAARSVRQPIRQTDSRSER